MTRERTHAFVGRLKCGKAFFLQVDEGRAPSKRDVGGTLKRGGVVERVTIQAARDMGLCFGCEACK